MRMLFYLLAILILCFLSTLVNSSTNYLPLSQYQALESLYNSADGQAWNWNRPFIQYGYPWDFSNGSMSNPCNITFPWQGVNCSTTCSQSNCSVIHLSLTNYNLQGFIPSNISQLTQLESLILNNNNLLGQIPSEITQLIHLQSLQLDYNKLTGSIPVNINNLTSLHYVYLNNNELQGSIPLNIGELSKLLVLCLNDNLLTSFIPSSIGQLTQLQMLSLYSNSFTSTLPYEIGNLTQLTILYVDHNSLTGTLPASIGNILLAKEITLHNNYFSGTIPSTIGNLINLLTLEFYNNHFSGTIPVEISSMSQLTAIYLNENHLTGTIPKELSLCKFIIDLDLFFNDLTGTIPPELSQLTLLTFLNINSNILSGTIPPELSQLSFLYYFDIYYNQLTGTIPSSLSQIPTLEYFNLYFNLLTGTIPIEFGQTKQLRNFALDHNLLTGTIPSELGQLSYLTFLFLYRNDLTGSIPSSLGQLTSLLVFDTNDNHLSGIIPNEMGNLSMIQNIDLSKNYLTFRIPMEFMNLTELNFISLSNNKLTSSVPSFFLTLPKLLYLDISHNSFDSFLSIDSTKKYFPLKYFDVSYNSFTGTFPSKMIESSYDIEYINLANNQFTGTIPSSTKSNYLRMVYLQNNSFSGSIPESLVGMGNLTVFMASLNCLSGTIPKAFCQNKDLNQLILDGLHSSGHCIRRLASWSGSSSYIFEASVNGDVPTCFFELEHLYSLHISGNNLEGSLPQILNNKKETNLTTLNLANNKLTGPIPSFILSKNWFILDLSFNQFDSFGEDISDIQAFKTQPYISSVSSNYLSNASIETNLRLQVNHLSGHIPSVWENTSHIDILEGNMFSCKPTRNDLPKNDPLNSSYNCGSDDTNLSFYLIVSITLILISLGFLFFGRKYMNHSIKRYENLGSNRLRMELYELIMKENELINLSNNQNKNDQLQKPYHASEQMLLHCEHVGKWGKILIFWLIFVISIMYISLTSFYGTYKHQYIWILSSSYLSGLTPSIIMLIVYLITLFWYTFEWFPIIKQSDLLLNLLNKRSFVWKEWCIKPFLVLINVFIVLLINICYVIAINHGYPSSTMTFVSIALSLFKIIWNDIMLLGLGRKWIETRLNISLTGSLLLLVTLFNNIIVPYIAEAFVSPNCFLYVITDPPEVLTTFYNIKCYPVVICDYLYCSYRVECGLIYSQNKNILFNSTISSYNMSGEFSFDRQISHPNLESLTKTSYLPPFHYNFTCSSSLLSSFGYVFVYRYIISTFLLPMFLWWIKEFQKKYEKTFDEWKIKTISLNIISTADEFLRVLTMSLPALMKFEYKFPSKKSVPLTNDSTNTKDHQNKTDIDPRIYTLQCVENSLQNISIGQNLVINLILDMTMMMSFGILFPPLGILILLSIARQLILQLHYFHRFIKYLLFIYRTKYNPQNHTEEEEEEEEEEKVSNNNKDIENTLDSTIISKIKKIIQALDLQYSEWSHLFCLGIWWVILVASWFWAICLYDTMGKNQGTKVSLWVLLLMGFAPYLTIGCFYLFQYIKGFKNKTLEKQENFAIEINPMSKI